MEPNQKPVIHGPGGSQESDQTYAEIHLSNLTPEVLRDVARNDSSSKAWRKAAIRFLMARGHKYQHHSDFRELREEIREEQEAEQEVQAIVESAVEGPLAPEKEL